MPALVQSAASPRALHATFALPAAPTAGNLLVLILSHGNTDISVTSGWTRLHQINAGSFKFSERYLEVWTRAAQAGDGASFSLLTSGSGPVTGAWWVGEWSSAMVGPFAYGLTSVDPANAVTVAVSPTTTGAPVAVLAGAVSLDNDVPTVTGLTWTGDLIEQMEQNDSEGRTGVAWVIDETANASYSATVTGTGAYTPLESGRTYMISVVLAAPVVAAFSGSPVSGSPPLAVTFTDLSIGAPTSWLWDFGDSTTSTAQNPVHTYATNGVFTVTLTATNASGSDSEVKAAYISTASGSAPRGISGAPEYVIELFDSGATFGPNNRLAEIWDARNVGWSRYDRMPGKAFFTLAQGSVNQPLLVPLTTHINIWRITPTADTLVYRGAYIDYSAIGDDVVNDCFDYVSLLSLSRAGFKTLYPTKLLGTEIVSPEWTLAQGAGSSPLGFVTTGTIENPLALDGVTAIKTNAEFGTLDQTRLQIFYDLTEMGRANTANHVTYEIDLTNTFNFWKNRGVASEFALVLGGNISEYTFLPGWSAYRNDVATIGVGAAGGAAELVATNAAEITAKGRRQDVTTLKTLAGIATGATETDQQKAALERELKSLVQQSSALMLRVARGKVEPFVGYNLNDTAHVEISNGNDLITTRRRIVGIRCMFAEAGEDIDLMLAPVAS